MTMPDLTAKAQLNTQEWDAGVSRMLKSLSDLQKQSATIKITADLSAAKQVSNQVEEMQRKSGPITLTAKVSGVSDVISMDDRLRDLNAQVRTTRDLWQANVLSNEEAAQSVRLLRDELLSLAAAEELSAQQMVKATNAAAAAQRTLDASQGRSTRGGFAYSASIGIIEALGNMGGPAGAAASMVGQYIVDGLNNAMEKGKPKVATEATEVSEEIVRAMKERLKIHSPSVVMQEIGQFAMDGLIAGFKSKQEELKAVIANTAQQIPQSFVVGTLGEELAAPLVDGLGVSLEVVPEIFQKAFAGAIPAATDAVEEVADSVELNVAPAFDGLALGFESASGKLAGFAEAAAPAEEAMNTVAAATGTAGDEAEEAGEQAEESGNGFEQLSGYLALAAAGVTAFAGALAVAVPKAAEFQAAMQTIAAESQLTQADLQAIGDGLLDVSSKTGIAATDLAKAAYDIVGAGVKGAEANEAVVKLTEQSAMLAKAGLTDVGTAADVLTSALNAYNLSAEQATHVSDSLITVVNTGKVSLDQMGGALTEVFPIASQLGVNIEELGAAVAGLTSIGVPAEQAVTGIRGALDNILKPSEEAKQAAKDLGIEFSATALKAKGLPKFLEEVKTAANGSTAVMAELFGDVEALNAVFGLTGDAGARKFAEALEAQASAAGATATAYADVAATFTNSQARFAESVNNLQIEFGQKFLPVLTKATNGLADFIGNLDELADGLSKNVGVQFIAVVGGAVLLTDATIKLAGAMKAATLATGAFQAVTNAGGVIAYVSALAGMQVGLTGVAAAGTAATVALTPLSAVALAVGAAFAGWKVGEWIGNMKLFGDEIMTVNDGLTDVFAKWMLMADGWSHDEAQQAIADMRVQDIQLAKEQADANVDVSDAVNAVAEAERQSKEEMEKANAAREEEVNKLREQKKAITELRDALEEREFKLEVAGLSEMGAEIAQLGKEFDDLREKLKAPFYDTEGQLQMTDKLREALDLLDKQKEAEAAAITEKYAKDAAAKLKDATLEAQKMEVEAMVEGAAKKRAQREIEIRELEADLTEQAALLADFPEKQAAFEEQGRRQVAALRRQYANEDAEEAREAAEDRAKEEKEAEEKRIEEAKRAAEALADARKTAADAIRDATDAEIDAMAEGRQRTRAERQLQLDDERASLDERLAELAEYPALQAQVEEAAHRKVAALRQKWVQEDEKDAREAALRIAKAWAAADKAAAASRLASMQREQARFELQAARQRAALEGNDLEQANLDAGLVARRAELEQRAAEQAYADRLRQMELAHREELSAEDLTAQEKLAIQQRYLSEVAGEEDRYQADNLKRIQQREEAERQAAEAILEARKKAAQEPIAAAEREAKRLSTYEGLVQTDRGYERLQAQIAQNLERQLGAQQKYLSQADELKLTAEERKAVEDKIFDIQAEQLALQQKQEDRAKRLKELAQQRRDAELAYAVAVAKTDAELVKALQDQLAKARKDQGEAANEMTGAKTQEKRDEAAKRYLDYSRQILGLEQQIASVPLTALERRLALRESERDLQREINGLTGDAVAEARDDLATAQAEVNLARQRLQLADTEAEREEASANLNKALTAELQAQRSLRQAQIDQQREQYDLDEARARAMLALRGQGDDAVAGARLDLAITQRNLRDINARLAEGNLTRRERTQLEIEQQRLVAQQAGQQRQLNDALEARAELMRGLRDAEQGLRDASGEQLRGVALATRDLTRARQELTRAEREYARALQSNDPAKIKEATEQLTGAVQKHRDAMRGLAAEYRKTIGDMDGVRDAAARLGQALYGEDGPEYDSQREADRLAAIMARRNEALKRFQEAVASGNQEAIAAALADLAAQQERLQEQTDKMEKNGQSVTDRSRKDVESAFNVADRLGIAADRMAGPLERQAAAIDKEAEAIQAFGGHVDRFANALVAFRDADPSALLPNRALDAAAAGAPSLPDTLGDLRDLLKGDSPLNTTLRQLQQVLTPPSTPLAAAIPTAQPVPQMTYTDNSQQTVQIYQQPGESAEALWARIKPVISRDFGLDRAFNGPCGNR